MLWTKVSLVSLYFISDETSLSLVLGEVVAHGDTSQQVHVVMVAMLGEGARSSELLDCHDNCGVRWG